MQLVLYNKWGVVHASAASALIVLPHSYSRNKTHGHKHGYNRGTAIAKERQRKANDRGNPDTHADILKGLKQDDRTDSKADQHT